MRVVCGVGWGWCVRVMCEGGGWWWVGVVVRVVCEDGV